MNPTIVFDLDGTLADTRRDLIPCLNRTIASAGVAPVEFHNVGYIVGHGSRAMIERAFALTGTPLGDLQLDALQEVFLEDYGRNICAETVLFDGAIDALDRFAALGCLLAVCTNKPEGLARQLLDELGISARFAAISGGDTFTVRKPHADHLLKTVEMAGGNVSRSLMVGDSVTDIRTAQAAGIPVVAVDFGYSDRHVSDYAPDRVISHFSELNDAALALLGVTPIS